MPPVRLALERYAAGVNAASAELSGRMRPIEFQLLGITPPAWEPIDSLAVGRLLAWRLAENHQAELVRGALALKLGEATARELTGRYPAASPAIVSRGGEVPVPPFLPATGMVGDRASAKRDLALPTGLEWLAAGARRGNSNNW